MENYAQEEILSAEEVELLIKNKIYNSGFELIDYSFKAFGRKIGIFGDYFILRVVVILQHESKKKEFSFLAKIFPKYQGPAEFTKALRAFEKEIFFYNLFDEFKSCGINLIEFCTPAYYLSEYNRFIIFDNILLDGFQVMNKYKTLDYMTITTVIKALAKLHASSIIYEEGKSKEIGKQYRIINDHGTEFEEIFYSKKEGFINTKGTTASIKCVIEEIDLFEHREKLISGQNFKLIANELCHKIFDLVKPSKLYRNVLCHGDLLPTNLMLRYNEDNKVTDCKFVNFQCGRYVPPTHDLMAVIHLTTSRQLRKKHLYEFTGIYYATLEKLLCLANYNLKDIIPFADFMRSCEEQKLFAIIQAATYLPLTLLKDELMVEHFTRIDDGEIFEDRFTLISKNVAEDDQYKNRLGETIQDLRDYCEYL